MRRSVLIASLALSSGLAACVSEPRQAALPPQPQGIEGRWASVGGPIAYTVSLQNGRFQSTETGTGGVLASGTYSNLGPGQINIVYRSTTNNNEVAANCNQVQTNRLACATSTGSRFELSRA
ncbi:MAG: hypothetical protein KAG89_05040 [Fulvimarina manganoxydans]|uniref:hypothetical protein n=1 Tax=Fulvimarina manganoxydans TaxID=937218 RepID=UPI002356A1A5|nr:hypothetical protein [Fulvimarina manganoxydans]MCK5931517.1 hypothetical protein [Fulvimarina manganoxydans]MEE2950284.1 hypothetical protein [Pseudomonadota bacterium]